MVFSTKSNVSETERGCVIQDGVGEDRVSSERDGVGFDAGNITLDNESCVVLRRSRERR